MTWNKQKATAASLIMIGTGSLLPLTDTLLLWIWLGVVIIPLWGINLVRYIFRSRLWTTWDTPTLMIVIFVLAAIFNSFFESTPVPLEFQFLGGTIVWSTLTAVSIVAIPQYFHERSKDKV